MSIHIKKEFVWNQIYDKKLIQVLKIFYIVIYFIANVIIYLVIDHNFQNLVLEILLEHHKYNVLKKTYHDIGIIFRE